MSTAPRICFLGPMIGIHPGRTPSQGEIVSGLLIRDGRQVLRASQSLSRAVRLLDVNLTLIHHRKNLDVVCAEVYGGRSFVVEDSLSLLCRALRLPLVMVLHGGNMPNFMAQFPNWSKRVLQRADALVAPSQYLADAAKRHGFAVKIIPNVIDLDGYPYRHRQHVRPHLFWMRSFHPIYNPMMAIHVLSEVRQRHPDAKLVMAGQDKGIQETARQLAADLQIAQAVSFPGFVSMAQKVHFAGISDIFINTNHVDNMPVAVLEMAAMGLPVVSTNVGGIPYLLEHEDTGLLVPDGDVRAMTHAVFRLLDTPSLAGLLSINGRRLAEQSAWTEVRPQWDALFDAVLAERRR